MAFSPHLDKKGKDGNGIAKNTSVACRKACDIAVGRYFESQAERDQHTILRKGTATGERIVALKDGLDGKQVSIS